VNLQNGEDLPDKRYLEYRKLVFAI